MILKSQFDRNYIFGIEDMSGHFTVEHLSIDISAPSGGQTS